MRLVVMIALLSSVSFSAFAQSKAPGEVTSQALKTLLRKNPMTVDFEGDRGSRVTDLIAGMMTSSFNAKGEGALSVIENSCNYIGRSLLIQCELNILNSDRVVDKNGAYAPADGMTESSLRIEYRVDSKGKTLIGNAVSSQAG